MNNEGIKDRYYKWLINIVYDEDFSKTVSYEKLLCFLYNTPFEVLMPRDENRVFDGQNLRRRFKRLCYVNADEMGYLFDKPCSVLEMLIALSLRCEESIMDDPKIGNRTGQWFWNMIVNIGLSHLTDTHFDADEATFFVNRFMHREYEPNGRGSIVTLNNPPYDLRGVEFWYQMMWYLTEMEREEK